MTERAHPTHLQLLATLEDEPRERDYPKDDNAPSIDVAMHWARIAARLTAQLAEMKACAVESERARLAGDRLTAALQASVLVQMAVKS